MNNRLYGLLLLVAIAGYWALLLKAQMPLSAAQQQDKPDLVLAEPVQVLLYGGDRFLAANVEAIRAQAAMSDLDTQDFRLRAHRAASLLNPCHEDNYWFGNASLSWGGAIAQGMDVLGYAGQCRFWDEWPLFFYAFNQNFFYQDSIEAQRVLKIAAARTEKNKAAFLTYATMLGLDQIKNAKIALTVLEHEQKQAKSAAHEDMLNKRIVRLKGLILLREAHATYVKKFGKELEQPDDLLSTGVLSEVPQDPLKLGYEFRHNMFQLKQMRVR